MTDKDLEKDQEFEKMLKDKMEELSDSVDCFGKISERVFCEEDADYSDSEFVVTDLENVTGRRRFSPLIKIAAAGLAAVFAVSVIPRTAFFRNFMCNVSTTSNSTFATATASVLDNTTPDSGMEFHVYDVSLDEYISKDVMVTPLYSCPFEDIGRDNVRVRVFVRTYNDVATNQMYAVEYSGEYKQANFIAVADTGIEFTDEQLAEAYEGIEQIKDTAIEFDLYKNSDTMSLTHYSIFSSGDGIYPLSSSFIFYKNGDDMLYETFHDIIREGGYQPYDVSPSDVRWKKSVYSDGTSALPSSRGTEYKKVTDVDGEEPLDQLDSFLTFSPYTNKEIVSEYTSVHYIEGQYFKFDVPVDYADLQTLTISLFGKSSMYFELSSQSDPKLPVNSDDESLVTEISRDEAAKTGGVYYVDFGNLYITEADDQAMKISEEVHRILEEKGISGAVSEKEDAEIQKHIQEELDKAVDAEERRKEAEESAEKAYKVYQQNEEAIQQTEVEISIDDADGKDVMIIQKTTEK